jgi:hypothetical protein
MLDNLGSRESEAANLAVADLEFVHGQGIVPVFGARSRPGIQHRG